MIIAPYPAEWEVYSLLADGGAVLFRPIKADDAALLTAMHAELSPETIHSRFFSAHPRLSDTEVARFTQVDYCDRMALVAVLEGRLVAVGRYDRIGESDEAEVAFVVSDAVQGRGIGSLLLEHLAAFARGRGIRGFVAETLADNHRMRRVFHDAGFAEQSTLESGVVQVRFSIVETEPSLLAMEQRERHAEVNSLRPLFSPRSIAVIGAGRRRGGIGYETFRNLLRGDFQGPVYPVNNAATHVAGVRAYPSIVDVPDDVDLAVITVPAAAVPAVVEECAVRNVKALVVITAGFAEAGPDGVALEAETLAIARGHGMRVVGPNCMGVINTADGVSMNATFAPTAPTPGRVAFMSQSGALGIAALQRAAEAGLGLSMFVSAGNKADVSGNDLLQYWESDAGTDVILLYLESVGNPRKFARIARRVSRTKPIVAVKSGRTSAGGRAARSHTASAATPDVAVDALFSQAGVIRVDTLQELFDVGQVLAHQPVASGPRLAIVSNAGGPGILAADACEAVGLEVPELSAATQAALRAAVPDAAAVTNPVDLLASAGAAAYEKALRIVLDDDGVDSVLAIFTPPLVTRPEDVAVAITAAVTACDGTKPVIVNFLGDVDLPQPLSPSLDGNAGSHRAVPWFPFPEQAVRALSKTVAYGQWRSRPESTVPELEGIDVDGARGIVDGCLGERPERAWLTPDVAARLVAAYGITVAPTIAASTAADAVMAADRIGYPVVLKAGSGDLVHKSDVGGVRLNLMTSAQVEQAFGEMVAALGDRLGGVIVQPMVPGGVETIVGVTQDPSFGPVVMFGLGGVMTDLVGDHAFRILPVTSADANEMLRSVRSSPLLFGYRGTAVVDTAALADVLLRVGRMAADLPELAEMDLNPVIVGVDGAIAVDIKVRLAPAPAGPGALVRRLR